MAVPTYLGAGTAAASAVADITPGLPVGYAANTVFLLIVETANQAVSAPAGWAEVTNSPQGTGTAGGASATRLTVFWKRAASGSETAPTVLIGSNNHVIARVIGFDGCRTSGNPWDVTSGDVEASDTTTVVVPGLTTTLADCLVVGIATRANDASTSDFSAFTNASLTGVSNGPNTGSTAGNGGGYAVYYGSKASAGVVSNWGGGTLATASAQGRMSIALTATTGTTKYVKLLAPAAAASAASIEGVVLNAARDTVIGEFTGQTFESSLESGYAVLKIIAANVSPNGNTLTTSDTPLVVAYNSTYSTDLASATVIEE